MSHQIPLVSFLFITLCFIHHCNPVSGAFEPFEVRIVNNLPDNIEPLLSHCKSGDNDLGIHNLTQNAEYHWDFKMNFRESTLYHCVFVWPPAKKIGFTVFNKDIAYKQCGSKLRQRNLCYWSVQDDGFYLANVLNPTNQQLHKMVAW